MRYFAVLPVIGGKPMPLRAPASGGAPLTPAAASGWLRLQRRTHALFWRDALLSACPSMDIARLGNDDHGARRRTGTAAEYIVGHRRGHEPAPLELRRAGSADTAP